MLPSAPAPRYSADNGPLQGFLQALAVTSPRRRTGAGPSKQTSAPKALGWRSRVDRSGAAGVQKRCCAIIVIDVKPQSSNVIAAVYARKSADQLALSDEPKSVTRRVAHVRACAARKGWTVKH